jgi:cytochrome c-type biogenesis protein CcmH/NrfG
VNRRQRGARIGVILLLAGLVLAGAYAARAWWEHRSVDHAARLFDRGEYGRAAHELLRTLVQRPDDPLTHYDLGRAYAGLGLAAAARRQLAEAVRLAPHNAAFHAALARAHRDGGDETMAIAEFDEAIRPDPADPRSRVDLAALLLHRGRVRDAVGHLRRAVQLEPAAADPHLLLAEELARLGERDEMTREYGQVMRLARGTVLAEVARQRLLALSSMSPERGHCKREDANVARSPRGSVPGLP